MAMRGAKLRANTLPSSAVSCVLGVGRPFVSTFVTSHSGLSPRLRLTRYEMSV